MAIFKHKMEQDYTVIPNATLGDCRLSWKAKGLLVYLLSLPANWEVHTNEVVKHATDGEKSLTSGLAELLEFKYVIRNELRGDKGKYEGYEYCVYSVPTETLLSGSR